MSENDPFNYLQIKEKKVSHKIAELKPNEKNIELRCIVIKKEEEKMLQNNVNLYKYLIGDSTGSIFCNFFNENFSDLENGEILYLNGFVTNLYKNKLVMYQSKNSKAIKIGKYVFEFLIHPNKSKINYK